VDDAIIANARFLEEVIADPEIFSEDPPQGEQDEGVENSEHSFTSARLGFHAVIQTLRRSQTQVPSPPKPPPRPGPLHTLLHPAARTRILTNTRMDTIMLTLIRIPILRPHRVDDTKPPNSTWTS
jgi:hypothetical protein